MYKITYIVVFSMIVMLHSCENEHASRQIFSGGTGIKSNPYQISNLEELKILSENHGLWDCHFILTEDIDASDTKKWNDGKGFSPIGYYKSRNSIYNAPFTGSFNGNGHVIENLYINRDDRHVGFFGFVQHSAVGEQWIENLGVVNCKIHSTADGLAAAGLAAANNGNIRKCYVVGLVEGLNDTGGLVGGNKGRIENCYAICHIHGGIKMGGLVGYNESEILNSYAVPQIKQGKYSDDVGGLIGYNNKDAKVIRCAWNKEISNIHRPCGRNLSNSQIRGVKTSEMSEVVTFNNWDFENIWKIDKENNGYPSLIF
jgi:hypothetical protein